LSGQALGAFGYGGRNRECRDASRRIICKLRGERYRNPSNEWLAKFIQEKLLSRGIWTNLFGGFNCGGAGSQDAGSARIAKIAKPTVETSVKVRLNLEKFVWSSREK
jgi:hypothetical protein